MSSDENALHSIREVIQNNLENFYEQAPCGYIFTLPNGTFISANETFLKWVNFQGSELFGKKRFQELLTVGCKIYYETNYSPLLRMQGFLNEMTLDLRPSGGPIFPVLINSKEVKDASGELLFVRSTLFNISDRRKYEQELLGERRRAERSEERFKFLAKAGETLRRSNGYRAHFKELVQIATDDFCDGCAIDLWESGRWVRVAESHRLPEKLLPSLPDSVLPADLKEGLLISDADLFSEEKGLQSAHPWIAEFVRKYEIQSFVIAPMLRDGEVVGLLSFYHTELGNRLNREDFDLAHETAERCVWAWDSALLSFEKERAVLALRENHEWLATTLRSIGDAVIAVNTDKTIEFLNSVAEELTGWVSTEAKGRPMGEVFQIINNQTGEPAFNPVEKVLKEGIVVGLANHTALIRKDGRKIIIEDSAAPIKGPDGELHGVVLVFRDTTQRHAEDERLKDTLLSLQEEREVREKFVATLTHDLRSPITAVKMSAQLILRKTDQPAFVQTQSIRIVNSVNRADQMIQDLLDANRLRAGEKIHLEMHDCDLAEEVREAAADLTTIFGDRFMLYVPTKVEGHWNCEGLRRVIENLCNNGIKYGALHKPIAVRLSADEDFVELSVHNEGNPVPEKDQATLFDPYRRTQSAERSGQKGWGLGLTLVRGVVEAHEGRVWVESSKEKGTTFFVRIPKRPSSFSS